MGFLIMMSALLLAPFLAPAQDLRIQPDIATAEAAFRDAEESWLHSDPNLEKDLLKVHPEEARRRVRRNAALRDDVMVKKLAYLDLIIVRTGEIRAKLAQNTSGMLPAETLKKDLLEQQSGILAQQDRLDQLLRDMPPGDEYFLVRRPIEEERGRLVNLQNNLAQRIRSLETLNKAQEAIRSSSQGDPLEERLASVMKLWEEERAMTASQRSKWAAVYAAMERAVTAAADAPPARGKSSTPRSVNDKEPASAAPSPSSKAKPNGLAGMWTYRSQPDAWTGYAEPAIVTLELHEEAGLLRGSYAARLPVKSGTHEVLLTVESTTYSNNSATLHWRCAAPVAEGEIRLKLSPDKRLLLERATSTDSFIPLGSEVLVPK